MCMGVLKYEGQIMRISAIQNCGTTCPKPLKNRIGQIHYQTNDNESKQDTVAFKGKIADCAGIGAFLGFTALTLISGGLATVPALLLSSGIGGTLGGQLGKAIKEIDERHKREGID